MSYREKISQFRSRWNLATSDAAEFDKFKARLTDAIGNIFMHSADRYEAAKKKLALLCGYYYNYENKSRFYEYQFARCLNLTRSAPDLLELTQYLLWTIQEHVPDYLPKAILQIKEVLECTPNLHVDIAALERDFVLYPAGTRMLDQALVEDNLAWLELHPEVLKHYKAALELFLSKDETKFRNALDNLRFSLEQLLKEVLGNSKSLENQKETLLRWLGSQGLHSSVIGMYNDLLFGGFAKYQNDAVKHNERYRPQEIEFMIYATGTFMRLLLQLSASKPATP